MLRIRTVVSHGRPYPYISVIPVSTDGQLMVADTAGLVADTQVLRCHLVLDGDGTVAGGVTDVYRRDQGRAEVIAGSSDLDVDVHQAAAIPDKGESKETIYEINLIVL